jgi:hypothetical protein
VSEQTLDAPPIEVPAGPPEARRAPARVELAELAYRYRWVLTAAVLLLISFVIVLWARARPGYDPYGWLVWGKLTIHLNLDTNGAPSWKPLPFLFTVPYAVVGHYALWLWMVSSVAISLSGLIFAWRIAFRLTYSRPERRYAAYVAGLCAAMFVVLMQDPIAPANYMHYVLSAESDTMIVALCLAAIDFHLEERHRLAFWMWWLAGLGRPEVWPFLGLAGLWLWWKVPSYRLWLYGALAGMLALWFGIPGISSKSFFTAGNIAQNSPRAIRGNKITGTITRFHQLEANPVWIAAALSVAWAAYRRKLAILAVAGGALAWLVIEIVLALKGFPAVPRYLFEAGAVVAVLAGVFVGRIVHELPALLSRFADSVAGGRVGARIAAQVGAWGTMLALLLVAGSMVGAAHRQYRLERLDLRHERARTAEIGRLSTVISRLGVSNIFACGQPNIPIEYQSVFAWYAGVKIGELYVSRGYLKLHPHPLVNVYPIAGGWKVFPSHVDAAHAAACGRMHLTFRR